MRVGTSAAALFVINHVPQFSRWRYLVLSAIVLAPAVCILAATDFLLWIAFSTDVTSSAHNTREGTVNVRPFLRWKNGKDKEFRWNWVHVKFCWICSIWYLLLKKLFQFERKKNAGPHTNDTTRELYFFFNIQPWKKLLSTVARSTKRDLRSPGNAASETSLKRYSHVFYFPRHINGTVVLGSLLQKWKPSESKLTECRFIFFSISVLFLQLMRGYLWDSGRNYVQVMQVNFEIWTKPVSVECLLQ